MTEPDRDAIRKRLLPPLPEIAGRLVAIGNAALVGVSFSGPRYRQAIQSHADFQVAEVTLCTIGGPQSVTEFYQWLDEVCGPPHWRSWRAVYAEARENLLYGRPMRGTPEDTPHE